MGAEATKAFDNAAEKNFNNIVTSFGNLKSFGLDKIFKSVVGDAAMLSKILRMIFVTQAKKVTTISTQVLLRSQEDLYVDLCGNARVYFTSYGGKRLGIYVGADFVGQKPNSIFFVYSFSANFGKISREVYVDAIFNRDYAIADHQSIMTIEDGSIVIICPSEKVFTLSTEPEISLFDVKLFDNRLLSAIFDRQRTEPEKPLSKSVDAESLLTREIDFESITESLAEGVQFRKTATEEPFSGLESSYLLRNATGSKTKKITGEIYYSVISQEINLILEMVGGTIAGHFSLKGDGIIFVKIGSVVTEEDAVLKTSDDGLRVNLNLSNSKFNFELL